MYGDEKTKAGNFPEVIELEWREKGQLRHWISFGMQHALFSPRQKDKRTKQQGSLSPEPVDKQQEGGAEFMIDSCRGTNAQLLYGWERGSDSVPQAHLALTELCSESV